MTTSSMLNAPSIFSYRKYWAHRFGIAPELPMTRAEMDDLGWDSCDVILVTGDAYIDHPSFGMALIGRLLEAQGFRVGIISQPDWTAAADFKQLGRPNLFFGVTGGNMDSMVNRYTSDKKVRSNDAYTPDGVAGKRPDRAVNVYSHRCREAFKDVPVIIGGMKPVCGVSRIMIIGQIPCVNRYCLMRKLIYWCMGMLNGKLLKLLIAWRMASQSAS